MHFDKELMMNSQKHVFHTKHDFKPELGWAAFQLLSEINSNGISSADLHVIAKAVGSPLTKRSGLNKVLTSMQDVGLIKKMQSGVTLSKAGKALAKGLGGYEVGFYTAVHCLYSWKWIWDRNTHRASPSWSYREVLKQILNSGSVGIDSDEIVLRLVSAAEKKFNTDKVSFSRSSVSGVTMWLEAQALPLIRKEGLRIIRQNLSTSMADAMRLHLSALCALDRGEIILDRKSIQLLSESILIQTDELVRVVEDFVRDSDEFLFISAVPNRVIFKDSRDPFIQWVVSDQ